MINLVETVGIQRLLKLIILLVVNGILGAGIYLYILPEGEASQRQHKAIKSEVSRLRNDINTIEVRLAELKENEKEFKRLLQKQFISDQDRVTIRSVIDDMTKRSGVRGLNYNIEPIQYVEHDHSYALNYDLIKSNVSMNMTSLIDLEILALQSMINAEFPGHTIIEKITYERTNPITKENLAKISTNESIDFMKGEIVFGWYSLDEKRQISEEGQ